VPDGLEQDYPTYAYDGFDGLMKLTLPI